MKVVNVKLYLLKVVSGAFLWSVSQWRPWKWPELESHSKYVQITHVCVFRSKKSYVAQCVCSWVNKADLARWQFYLFIKEVFGGNFQWLLTDCLVWMLLYLIITSSPWGLPDSSDGKESTCNAGDPGSLLGLGRPGDPGSLPAGEGIGYPLQYSWVSLVAQLVKNPPTIWETWAQSLGREEFPGEGKGSPLHYLGLENAMDCIVHGVTESQSGLSKFPFTSLHLPEEGGLLGESLKEKVIRRASPLKGESHATSVSKTGMKTHLHKICPDSVDS